MKIRVCKNGEIHSGFTVTELVTIVGILTVLAGLVLPAVLRTTSSARRNYCANNLRNIGVAYHSNAAQNSRSMSAYDWRLSVLEEMEGQDSMLVCPEDSRDTQYDIDDYTVYIVNNRRSIPLTVGTWCWIGDSEFCQQFAEISVDNPDAYFIGFEDLRYDTPFDGIILVEPLAEGGSRLTHVGGHPHAYRHQLKNPQGKVISDPFDKGYTWEVHGTKSSYAGNSRMRRFQNEMHKVLALEYLKPVANVVGPNAIGTVDYYTNVAPRHEGFLNVLYVDGRVEATTPDFLDPTNPIIHDQKWCPDIDARHKMTTYK